MISGMWRHRGNERIFAELEITIQFPLSQERDCTRAYILEHSAYRMGAPRLASGERRRKSTQTGRLGAREYCCAEIPDSEIFRDGLRPTRGRRIPSAPR